MARCASYIRGECTWGACQAQAWVPEWLGNANMWLDQAAARGLPLTDQPTLDAVAVFNDAGPYDPRFGHVGVVVAVAGFDRFELLEMNYADFNQYDNRWADRTGLLGFILPPGRAPGSGGPGPHQPPGDPLLDVQWAWQHYADLWNTEMDGHVELQLTIAQLARRITAS